MIVWSVTWNIEMNFCPFWIFVKNDILTFVHSAVRSTRSRLAPSKQHTFNEAPVIFGLD